MFDAHCHLDRCTDDPREILKRARQVGINHIMIAGVQADQWAGQNDLAGPGVHVSWGIHPWRVAQSKDDLNDELNALNTMLHARPVSPAALGETGLDYGKRIDPTSHAKQRDAFRKQIHLAKEHQLPLILHVVRAHEDTIRILKEEGLPEAGGMVHSFSGNDVQARQYLQLDLHISFSGSVTNPKSTRIRKAAAYVPENRLLVETDAPDQTPIERKPQPNEPAFLIDVIAAIAELRGCPTDHLAQSTAENAHTLFGTQSS